ncbi:MAG: tRNA (adenosine(37)-N6)-threonylcarbamoyltransferase complex dimerization subunit type 1 TsaB [Marinibacterium sp.]
MTTILAFDTSGPYCAAALWRDGQILSSRSEDMTRGQAERLMSLLETVLSEAKEGYRDLDAIGVGTGPGNYTGLRVGVSAARGLALGLGIPAYGVAGFDAVRHAQKCPVAVVLPAQRDSVYLSLPQQALVQLSRDDAVNAAQAAGLRVIEPPPPANLAGAIAAIAGARFPRADPRPKPIYLRPADAAPARDAPPVLLD